MPTKPFAPILPLILLGSFLLAACDRGEDPSPAGPGGSSDSLRSPAALEAAFEPRREQVHLRWPRVDYPGLAGYVVYRATERDPVPEPVHEGIVPDTAFADTRPEDAEAWPGGYSWFVKAIDSGSNVSPRFSPSARIGGEEDHAPEVRLEIRGAKRDTLGETGHRETYLVGRGKPVVFVAQFSHSLRRSVAFAWYRGGEDVPFRSGSLDLLAGDRSIDHAWHETGVMRMRFRLTDAAGWEWWDSLDVGVYSDPPKAVLASLSGLVLTPADTLRLTGRGSSDFLGSVEKYWWRIGNGAWVDGPRDTALAVAAFGLGDLSVRLKVVDDDGFEAMDSLVVRLGMTRGRTWTRVGEAPLGDPEFDAGRPAVSFAGRIRLLAKWKAGDSLVWGMGSTEDGAIWDITPVPFLERSQNGLVVHDGRLWVFGGQARTTWNNALADVWSSTDGTAWTQETGDARFGRRSHALKVAFGGRLWSIGGSILPTLHGIPAGERQVWSSTDGREWVLEGETPGSFPYQGGLDAALVFGERLLAYSADRLWESGNGKTWSPVSAPAYPGLHGRGMAVVGGLLWSVAGTRSAVTVRGAEHMDATPPAPEVWASTDGVGWTRATADAGFGPRAHHTTVAHGGKVWVIGGFHPTGEHKYNGSAGPLYHARPVNDVWVSD